MRGENRRIHSHLCPGIGPCIHSEQNNGLLDCNGHVKHSSVLGPTTGFTIPIVGTFTLVAHYLADSNVQYKLQYIINKSIMTLSHRVCSKAVYKI